MHQRNRVATLFSPLLKGMAMCTTWLDRSRIVAAALLLATLAPLAAEAGMLKVTGADPGSKVLAYYPNKEGKNVIHEQKADEFGKTTFNLGDQLDEKNLKIVSYAKFVNGKAQNNVATLTFPETLVNLEPFQVPSFTANTSLLARVDLNTFLAQPNPFQIGESLLVTNGSILESSAITFKDLSGISNLPDSIFALTPSQIDALPNFTGTATVVTFDQFEPLPEPSTFTLLGTSILCLLGYGWRRRKLVV
jgi:hypothetical protein